MEKVSGWFEGLSGAQSTLIGYLPNLLGALALLVAGWLVARLARAGTLKLGTALNRGLERLLHASRVSRVRVSPRIPELAARVVFWLVILFFVTAAARVAGLDVFHGWLDRIVVYLPNLVAGALIVLLGYLLAAMVRDLLAGTFASAGIGHGELAGRLAEGAIVLVAVVMGIDQIGIDVSFLVTVVAIVAAAVLGGISLAFGLGARGFVGNLIGAHHLRQEIEPGQKLRIGEIEGEVVALTATNVVLATAEGRALVPARLFGESVATLLVAEQDDD